ncbi:MAG: ATP-binding protein [Calditrichia bacterium]
MSVKHSNRILNHFTALPAAAGMAITKQLVTQMNGTISAISQTGKNTLSNAKFSEELKNTSFMALNFNLKIA